MIITPPRGARSKETNLRFLTGCTQHRNLGSLNSLLVKILKIISSRLWKLSLQIVLIHFALELSVSFLASPLFPPVQSFFPPPSLIMEVEDFGMESLLRESCNLPQDYWSAVTFCQLFTKNMSLPAVGTLGSSFFRNNFFINGCLFGKSLTHKLFGWGNTNWCSYIHVKISLIIAAAYPLDGATGGSLQRAVTIKARKVVWGPSVCSDGLGNCCASLFLFSASVSQWKVLWTLVWH